jgi:uncharacterized protein (TIGR02594 family)
MATSLAKKSVAIILSVLLSVLAISELDQRLCWGINHPRHIQVALNELHQRTVLKVPIMYQNGRIIEYCKVLDKKPSSDDAEGYCAAFTLWCLDKAGIGSGFPRSAYGYAWTHLMVGTPPKEGDLVFCAKDGVGHVGFLYRMRDNGTFDILGGNQNSEVCLYQKISTQFILSFVTVDYDHGEDIKRWYGKWMKKIRYFLFNK